MNAGVMQPYLFPYLGYFDLIFRTNTWVVLDITQYTPQTWMNRNRILHPQKGWQYITAPVKKVSEKQPISTVLLASLVEAKKGILKKLELYRKSAPYYSQVIILIEQTFDSIENDSLVSLNISSLTTVCKYLGIPFAPIVASERAFLLPEITYPGQWALEICSLLEADLYINPPGGRLLFRPDDFNARKIQLAFTRVPDFTYECGAFSFEPHLSILDVLMWNSPEYVFAHLGRAPLDYA